VSTLLLRLAGPMQAWGTLSRFRERDTGREPSKSGVVGLLCAALGKPRDEQPDDGYPTLAELGRMRMGVRVDRPGVVLVDYQTAGGGRFVGEPYGVRKASGSARDTVLSNRYYLADARFLVGLEGEHTLLARLNVALRWPAWQLCLGRKAFVPSEPVWQRDGLIDLPLEGALRKDWPPDERGNALQESLPLVIDDEDGESVRNDVPVSFLSADRRFTLRRVKASSIARDD
jgi:CRISPR system Cascade subunit CasD